MDDYQENGDTQQYDGYQDSGTQDYPHEYPQENIQEPYQEEYDGMHADRRQFLDSRNAEEGYY